MSVGRLHQSLHTKGNSARQVSRNSRALAVVQRQRKHKPVGHEHIWCPRYDLALRAWQQQLAALRHLDVQLVAASPQTPHNSLTTAK